MSGEHDWLAILIQANPKRGLTTREVAEKMGCSQRLVQVVVKYFKEHGRSQFFDKINGGGIHYSTDALIPNPITLWCGTVKQ